MTSNIKRIYCMFMAYSVSTEINATPLAGSNIVIFSIINSVMYT